MKNILLALLLALPSLAHAADLRINAIQSAQIQQLQPTPWTKVEWNGPWKSTSAVSTVECRLRQGIVEFSGVISDPQGSLHFGTETTVLPEICRQTSNRVAILPGVGGGNQILSVYSNILTNGSFEMTAGAPSSQNFYVLAFDGLSFRK